MNEIKDAVDHEERDRLIVVARSGCPGPMERVGDDPMRFCRRVGRTRWEGLTLRSRFEVPLAATAAFAAAVSLGLSASAASDPDDVNVGGPQSAAMAALVDVVARRVEIGDAVAAAKWGTATAIEDPVREKAVLDAASAKASEYGVSPTLAAGVFSDQIAASKVVQYGLFSWWTAHRGQAPSTRPDLAQLRPALDQITVDLLAQLRATVTARIAANCGRQLRSAEIRIERDRGFDRLHREALERALTSICS
jgi:chorismate mutase